MGSLVSYTTLMENLLKMSTRKLNRIEYNIKQMGNNVEIQQFHQFHQSLLIQVNDNDYNGIFK